MAPSLFLSLSFSVYLSVSNPQEERHQTGCVTPEITTLVALLVVLPRRGRRRPQETHSAASFLHTPDASPEKITTMAYIRSAGFTGTTSIALWVPMSHPFVGREGSGGESAIPGFGGGFGRD